MSDLVSRVLLVSAVAFAVWIVMLAVLSRIRMPFAPFIAALASWVSASLVLGWTIAMLKRTGWWPL